MVSFSPELAEQLKAFGVESYNHFMAKSTAEQQAAQDARQNADEATKAQEMNRITAEFAECDGNGDGRLNEEEWNVFFIKQQEQRKRENNYVEPEADSASKCFALLNQISDGDGFTIEEFFAAYGKMREGMLEVKAAAAQ